MRAPAHIAFGVVFTGSVAALSDINILESASVIGLVIVGSLLPDIDHPKSLIGRPLSFLSNHLFAEYGHRTITHSTLFVLLVFTLFRCISFVFSIEFDLAYLMTLSVISHILLDMFTVQGVQLFYPFVKNNCVVPGNPSYRLSTNNMSHEVLVICVCVMMTYFFKDLMTNGFWTTYNQKFSSIEHLMTEYKRTDKTLFVDLTYKDKNKQVAKSGYMIDLDGTDIILADSSGLSVVPVTKFFRSIDFYPTELTYDFTRHSASAPFMDSIDTRTLTQVVIGGRDNIQGYHGRGTFDTKELTIYYPEDLKFVHLPDYIYGYVYTLEFNDL